MFHTSTLLVIVSILAVFVCSLQLVQANRNQIAAKTNEPEDADSSKATKPVKTGGNSLDQLIKANKEKHHHKAETAAGRINGSSKQQHLAETSRIENPPTIKQLTKKGHKGVDPNAVRCARTLVKSKVVFEGQLLTNWKCEAVYDDDSAVAANKRLVYCACQHDYDCSETEQYYFDFAAVTEQFYLENRVDLNSYTSYCESRINLATNAVWSCKVTEETLNAYEDYHSQQTTPNNSPYDNDTYCECKTKKTCIYQKLVWNRPARGQQKANDRTLREE